MSFCSRRSWDIYLTAAHGAQAVTYLVLALLPAFNAALIPITLTVPTGRPGANTTEYIVETLFSGHPVAEVSTFFFITAIFHAIRGAMGYQIPDWDRLQARMNKVSSGDASDDDEVTPTKGVTLSEKDLDAIKMVTTRRDTDRGFRWLEYSLTSTLMILVISQVSGITDLYALVAIGVCNTGMILFGSAGDKVEHAAGKWRAFWFGCIVGLLAWAIIFSQTILLGVRAGPAAIPFVLAISITMFTLFWSFSVAEFMYIKSFSDKNLLRAEIARERTEFIYQLLSATAKTTLGALVGAASLTMN